MKQKYLAAAIGFVAATWISSPALSSEMFGGSTVDTPTEFMGQQMAQDDNILFVSTQSGAVSGEMGPDLSADEPVIKAAPTVTDDMELTAKTLEEARLQLAQAREIREKAELEYQDRMAEAQKQEASRLLAADQQAQLMANQLQATAIQRTIDPVVVLNERVNVELKSATLQEIIEAIMPAQWRVEVRLEDNPSAARSTMEFTSTDKRQEALAKIQVSLPHLGIHYFYFFDLVDSNGNPKPKLVVTDQA